MSDEERFMHALSEYEKAAADALAAEEAYRVAHADAMLAAEGSNAEKRKAAADAATSEERKTRDLTALRKDVKLHMLQYLKGLAARAAA